MKHPWLSVQTSAPASRNETLIHVCCCGWVRTYTLSFRSRGEDFERMGRSVASHNARCAERRRRSRGRPYVISKPGLPSDRRNR